uniref:NADH-ubiquinone oxidoreductase chain 2 n=1 Tax=Tegula lividomaculata TaxID=1764038 RepID=A0A109PQX1_9VEST|nr:NADH dehydrogenase subunit 2 [Tegula lividomaculata]AMA07356.1 NADH dehydrogenase subunit 2 [Tegula lividomaculata]
MFSMMPFSFLFIFIFIFGSVMSLSSVHWIGIWLGLEINLIGFIPILVYGGVTQETESGMKYFVVQALGSGMLMMGSLISFNLLFTWETLGSSNFVGLFIIAVGMMLKLGSFPFHFWLPSVMAGISWFSCLVLTTWQKLAPMFLLSSIIEKMWTLGNWINFLLIFMAGMASLVGGIGGLNQTQIRALLAYSSIGHVGWMLLCCVMGQSVLKVYFLVYFVISICIFLVLWSSENSMFSQTGSLSAEKAKSDSVYLIFMLLSLGGMPPLLGFVGKWMAIWFCCKEAFPLSVGLLLIGSLISLSYYLSLLFSVLLLSGTKLSVLSSDSYMSSVSLVNFPGKKALEPKNLKSLNFWKNSSDEMLSSLVVFIFMLNLLGGIFIFLSLILADFL